MSSLETKVMTTLTSTLDYVADSVDRTLANAKQTESVTLSDRDFQTLTTLIRNTIKSSFFQASGDLSAVLRDNTKKKK